MLNPIGAATFIAGAASHVLGHTDGVRAVTALACNTFEFLQKNNIAVLGLEKLHQRCKQFYVVLFGFRIADRIDEFASGKAYTDKSARDGARTFNFVRLVSRVALTFNDLFACLDWLEDWGIIAAKTGSNVAVTLFGTGPNMLLPVVNWVGSGADLADHFSQFVKKPSLDATFDLIGDASRLISIGLTATPGFIKFGADVTYSLVFVARYINKYVSHKAASAA